MAEGYRIKDDGIYFVTFTVVGWLDVFTRRIYQEILIDSLEFCQSHKNLKLYCYCIMPNHLHFVGNSENGSLAHVLKVLKSYTAREIMRKIKVNQEESRRVLFIEQFRKYAKKHKKAEMQFWQHGSHCFYLYSNWMIDQKINYIHNNPVVAGFVNEPYEWRMISANSNGPLKIEAL